MLRNSFGPTRLAAVTASASLMSYEYRIRPFRFQRGHALGLSPKPGPGNMAICDGRSEAGAFLDISITY
jgi:hypothetical protein